MIETFKLYFFEVPLKTRLRKRKGILLELIDSMGDSYWGEISPLEGWSSETLDKAFVQLSSEVIKLSKQSPEISLTDVMENASLLPSVSMGLFGALQGLLRKNKPYVLSVSGLLYGSYAEIKKQLPYLEEQGFAHVKLKTSSLSFSEAKELIDFLEGKYILRIDVNRSWAKEQADAFFSWFQRDRFEYIEDPYPKGCDLKEFSYPLGADEALREMPLKRLCELPHLKAVVLKPMLMGFTKRMQELSTLAKQKHWIVSLSSSFETGVGLYQIALFAEYFGWTQFPLGLDTYRFLSPDLLQVSHTIQNGKMHFSSLKPSKKFLSEAVYA